MAVRTITTKLAIDGEAEYKQKLKNINAELRLYKSELANVDAQYAGQMNSLEALQAKEAALVGQLEVLGRKSGEQAAMLDKAKEAERTFAAEAADLQGQLDKLTRSFGDTSKEEEELTKRLNKANANMQDAAKLVLDYQKSMNYTARDQTELNRALEETRKYLDEARNSMDKTASSIDGLGNHVDRSKDSINALAAALAAAGVARGLQEIAGSIRACVDASVDFESAMAGVQKVTKMSDADISAMAEDIKRLSTEIPATTTDIASVAESAARLGIAREDILSFTRVMLDLGESSNLSADEAATALARFANIAGTSSSDYERLGSAIVALGNNFATSESEITAMASKLASAGTLAGLAEPEIMALAAAMSSVGIEAEAGGTAMTQTLTAMEKAVTDGGSKLEEFARIAGLSSGEFAETWKREPIAAIQAFIAGLGGLDEAGESATAALDNLGLSGVRQSNMLKSLGLAAETLEGTVRAANTAWAENIELAETAAARYETTEAKMQMAANAAGNLKIAVGDALAPALGNLAEAGSAAFSWAAEFIEANPWLVQVMTAGAVGVGVFTTALTVYSARAQLAAIKTAVLGASMNAIPAITIVSAISALVVALGLLAASSDGADNSVRELQKDLKASKSAYEETKESIRQSADAVNADIAALEQLAAEENKTAAQKAALAEIVDRLNASVPELSLAYDAQADSLNMTAEAVRNLAQAEAVRLDQEADVRRLVDLYEEQKRIESQLAEAKDNLTEAQKRLHEELMKGMDTTSYEADVDRLQRLYDSLNRAMAENQSVAAELEGKYGSVADSADDLASAAGAAGNGIETLTGQMQGSAVQAEELREATLGLTGAVSKLDAALKEQADSGSLSLTTALDLIDAGYGAALAIDKETGAIELNQAAYIHLTQAKIDSQIESIQFQQAINNERIRMNDAALMATELGEAYATAAEARSAMLGENRSFAAQIVALEQLRDRLNNYTFAAKSSAAASKAMQTKAQKDLAEYKDLVAELDHQRNLDAISERDYYTKLKEYRDQYLTDEGNLAEYRRVTEQIYQYDKTLAENEAELWTRQTDALVDELESRVKGAESQRQNLEKNLSGYGDLFTVDKNGKMTVNNLQEGIDKIQEFQDTLEQLRERGLNRDLLSEIASMSDVDKAVEYGKKLLAKAPEDFEKYSDLWAEKQRIAVETAENFYKEQVRELETKFGFKLGEAMDGLVNTAFQGGEDVGQGLIEGLASTEDALYAQIGAMEVRLREALSGLSGLSANVPTNAEINDMFASYSMQMPRVATAQDMQNIGSAIVNGMQTAAVGGQQNIPPIHATLVTPEGTQVAEYYLPYLINSAAANGTPIADTQRA